GAGALLDGLHASHLEHRRAPRRLRREALGRLATRQLLEVRAHLGVEVLVQAAGAEERPPEAPDPRPDRHRRASYPVLPSRATLPGPARCGTSPASRPRAAGGPTARAGTS